MGRNIPERLEKKLKKKKNSEKDSDTKPPQALIQLKVCLSQISKVLLNVPRFVHNLPESSKLHNILVEFQNINESEYIH